MRNSVTTIIIILLTIIMIGNYAMADEIQENTPQTADEFLKQGDDLFSNRQFEEAREAYTKAAEIAKAEGLNSQCTEAISMIARTYLTTDQKEEGRVIFAKVVETATPNDPMGWSRYLSVRGRFEWKNGTNEKAAETFKEMYYYSVDHEIHDRAADAARMIGITGTPEEQIEWGLKGIAEAEAAGQTGILGPLWNNLGATYEEQKEYDKCLEAYLKAREYHYKTGDELSKLIADWAVGHAYRLTADNKKAEKILKPLLKKFEEIDNIEFIGWTLKDLGHIQMYKHKYDKAVELFFESRAKLIEVGIKDWGPQYYQEINMLLDQAKMMHEESK